MIDILAFHAFELSFRDMRECDTRDFSLALRSNTTYERAPPMMDDPRITLKIVTTLETSD